MEMKCVFNNNYTDPLSLFYNITGVFPACFSPVKFKFLFWPYSSSSEKGAAKSIQADVGIK